MWSPSGDRRRAPPSVRSKQLNGAQICCQICREHLADSARRPNSSRRTSHNWALLRPSCVLAAGAQTALHSHCIGTALAHRTHLLQMLHTVCTRTAHNLHCTHSPMGARQRASNCAPIVCACPSLRGPSSLEGSSPSASASASPAALKWPAIEAAEHSLKHLAAAGAQTVPLPQTVRRTPPSSSP